MEDRGEKGGRKDRGEGEGKGREKGERRRRREGTGRRAPLSPSSHARG
jgi:hypothetical protein